ncbi:MAG TPA: SDR family oxidoreductase [Jatrophihabitantaceae bacterium]|jgi:NAD(P)-dependent dehydrogenase (short-subunit alcohol dehydrogenase family)
MEFTGKTALVTGATGGIGGEIAKLLAASGAAVVLSGRDKTRGDDLAASITPAGGAARFVAAELTDLDSVRALARDAGEVDVLISNAALFPVAPTVEQDVEGFDSALAANIRAPYFLTAAIAPSMLAKGSGAIVNVTTMAARIGMAGLSVYGATKAALESLTRTWAAEFSPAGVRVNAVAPGPTRTDMVIETMGEDGAAQVAATTLLGRLASPREIAEVAVFLASPRASFLTGAVIAADAGRTAV